MNFSDERLGLLNWGLERAKWIGIDFHLIAPEDRPKYCLLYTSDAADE